MLFNMRAGTMAPCVAAKAFFTFMLAQLVRRFPRGAGAPPAVFAAHNPKMGSLLRHLMLCMRSSARRQDSGTIKFLRFKEVDMLFGDSGGRKKLEQQRREEGRLPPGQSLTLKWPVLHAGNVPHVDLSTWDFRVNGLVDKSLCLSWEEFNKLPQTQVQCDMHC